MEIGGFCDERFAEVRELFEQNFAVRGDIGASFAATIEGEYVIDLWGGYRNADRSQPWERDTIANVYSTTKTMTFLSALILADRGELDLNRSVAFYWPEFSAGGRAEIPVRYLLSHSAGLPGFSRQFQPKELYDWKIATDDLASQDPWWEPGTKSGYHAITQGFLIGEVVRRITGKTPGNFFRENVAEPLNADFHIGLNPAEFNRVADLVPDPDAPAVSRFAADPDSIGARVFGSVNLPVGEVNSRGWRCAEIPAANGHGNARSVVRAQTAMANDGRAFGVEVLSPAGCARALEVQIDSTDLVLGMPIKFAMGYAYGNKTLPVTPNENALWWAGAGGSTIVVDRDNRLCVSYVMNQMKAGMIGDERSACLTRAVYAALTA